MSTDDELDAVSVDNLLALAKTKSDLQELVRMLHTRNLRLQRVRDRLAHQLFEAHQPVAPTTSNRRTT